MSKKPRTAPSSPADQMACPITSGQVDTLIQVLGAIDTKNAQLIQEHKETRELMLQQQIATTQKLDQVLEGNQKVQEFVGQMVDLQQINNTAVQHNGQTDAALLQQLLEKSEQCRDQLDRTRVHVEEAKGYQYTTSVKSSNHEYRFSRWGCTRPHLGVFGGIRGYSEVFGGIRRYIIVYTI